MDDAEALTYAGKTFVVNAEPVYLQLAQRKSAQLSLLRQQSFTRSVSAYTIGSASTLNETRPHRRVPLYVSLIIDIPLFAKCTWGCGIL